MRKLEDDKGVYLWEVRLDAVGEDGFYTEYSYQREGKYDNSFAGKTEVHEIFYDSEGIPRGSNLLATHLGNDWKDYSD